MTVYTTGWTGDEVVETPVVNVMLRVADARRFLELFRASRAYRLRVKITDEFIPDNNRIYDWEVGPEGAVAVQASPVGKSSVVSDHDDDTTKPWDLEISAEELALWLLGGQKKGKMMKNGAYADIFPMTRIHLPECV